MLCCIFPLPEDSPADRQQSRGVGKRPELQRYQMAAVRHHRDEDEETSQSNTPTTDSHKPKEHFQRGKCDVSEKVSARHGVTNGTEQGMTDVNTQNDKKESHSLAKTETNQAPSSVRNSREHQEPVGATKPTKKARKPDREFYQPGNRRSIQAKDCGVGRENDKPLPKKHAEKAERELQLSTRESEGTSKTSVPKRKGKDKEAKCVINEAQRKQQSQDVGKPPRASDTSVDEVANKVEKLSVKERCNVNFDGQGVKVADKQKRREKPDEERVEKERGNHRRKGGDKEKEKTDSKKDDDGGGRGKGERAKTEKERGKRETAKGSKGGENYRENRKADKDGCFTDPAKDTRAQITTDVAKEGNGRKQPNAKSSAPASKRYSKSDIRRSRRRTYSSSSASSVTSLDGPGPGADVASTRWPPVEPRRGNKERVANGRGSRSHLHSWTTNEESSAESLDGSETSDTVENRRRGKNGWEEVRTERQREERNKLRENKGGGRGILHISLERPAGASSQSKHGHGRQGVAPRGRGGGILVLPSRASISTAPEVGQSRLFGNRGGASSRSRGGRGGGVRRLWDPNNPEQKPALSASQSSPHSLLQQPAYLQTGYGQLHFLDTDDEVAGSPPVPQGEHFRSRQAAMAFYKFQNSDNPYCYPMSASNQHNPSTAAGQCYPYPYHMGPYQMSPTNNMYSGPGVGQFCGGYRGAGYTQSGEGGALTFEEVEQRARGELGRLLRAADAQELQLSNLLSRDRLSAEGLDRMAHLR